MNRTTNITSDLVYASDKKNFYLTSGCYSIKIRNAEKNSIKTIIAHNNPIQGIIPVIGGKKVISYDKKVINLWDANTFDLIDTMNRRNNSGDELKFSNDGKYFYDGDLWDLGAKTKSSLNSKINIDGYSWGKISSMAFSNTCKYMACYNAQVKNKYSIEVMDLISGQIIKTIPTNNFQILKIFYSANDKFIIAYGKDHVIKILDVENEKWLFSFNCKSMPFKIITNTSETLIALDEIGERELYDLNKNEFIILNLNPVSANLIFEFTPDNRFLVCGGYDGRARYLSVETGSEVLSLIEIPNTSDWIAVTPDGRFDGTEGGFKFMHFVKGVEIIPLESLFEKFYTPSLFSRVMEGEKFNLLEVDISVLEPKPLVKIASPENNSTQKTDLLTVIVEATDQGGGIDEVRLYHNGKLLDGTTRGFKSIGQNHEFTVTLTDGENHIKATAFNSQRTESIPDEIVVNYKAPQQVKPDMHILAVGINSYLNPKYSLNFAKNDAEAFTQSLQSGAASIFGKVNVIALSDANATRAGIMAAIDRIKTTAKAEDVFVFYYAGHGVMSTGNESEKPLFYLVPYDVTKMYEADDLLKKLGISATEIGEFSKNIKAQKQLFVIDACQSGGAMQSLAMRGAAEEKAIAQLARSTGTYFIAASGTEQFATEVAELGHGVL